MNYRNLTRQLIDAVVRQLHYQDNIGKIDLLTASASQIADIADGCRGRYMNDQLFHARVYSLVATILGVVRDCDQEMSDE